MKFINWCRSHSKLYAGISIALYLILDILLCTVKDNLPAMATIVVCMFGVLAVNIWAERQSKKIDDAIIEDYLTFWKYRMN